jgi:quinolinate synthase
MTEEHLAEKIRLAKEKRNAIVLAHNYQPDEIQALADFAGDSLELSRKAAALDEQVVVFCGVHFMAETAAILSPEKTVLLPALDAGCPMADMVTAEAVVISYVNSSAEVKAESDCCCTSSNATKVLDAYRDAREVIFVPDQNLGDHASKQTGAKMVPWEGYCPIHVRMTAQDVESARAAHPHALVMVHPECPPEVRAVSDKILSTGQMCRFAIESGYTEFIVGTECGLLYRLRRENPGKSFFPLRQDLVCEDMKRITPADVLASLRDLKYRITVPEPIASRARQAIERMIRLG